MLISMIAREFGVGLGAGDDQHAAAPGRPFDLERGPLLRCTFIRVAPEDHVCILTVHHLVTDWIAFQNVWTELSLLYEADAKGTTPVRVRFVNVHDQIAGNWPAEFLPVIDERILAREIELFEALRGTIGAEATMKTAVQRGA